MARSTPGFFFVRKIIIIQRRVFFRIYFHIIRIIYLFGKCKGIVGVLGGDI